MGWWGVIPLTSEEVAGALGLAAFEGQVARVCTDTRLLQPDDLFLALRGESYDGNALFPLHWSLGPWLSSWRKVRRLLGTLSGCARWEETGYIGFRTVFGLWARWPEL